jgi:transposase
MAIIQLHKRRQVIHLHREGISGRQIAQQLQISHTAVQKIVKKHKTGFGVENKPRPGRSRCLSSRMSHRIVICARKDPKKTARVIQTDVGLSGVVSIDTVKRELRRAGLFGRIAVKKPRLTTAHIKKRKQWCLDRRTWTVDKWKSVVFTDECLLNLNPNKREYVRRPKGARIHPNYTTATTKFSPRLMVWGAIRGDGKRILVRCERNVDSFEYQRIFGLALPSLCTSRYLFQQDGASSHRSHSTTRYLLDKAVRVLPDWPAQSPDLNIIEN